MEIIMVMMTEKTSPIFDAGFSGGKLGYFYFQMKQ